jgi:TM2 domain-containing membrane protein YozV
MKGFRRTIGLTILLICFLSAKTYSSTSKSQTYVSRGSSLTQLSSPKSSLLQSEHLNLLFAQQTNDSVKVANFESRKLKNPWVAFGIALVPGSIIHGAGHFYAGRIGTGFVLLGSELVGTGLIVVGLVGGIETITGEPREGWVIELEAGLVLFVGSWIYDIIGSPLVVMKSNKDLLQRKHGGLKIRIKDGNVKLVTTWSF